MPKLKSQNILSIEPPYLEQERKLSAPSTFDLRAVLAYVLDTPEHYAPPKTAGLTPPDMPREITGVRERVYFVDSGLLCFDLGAEFRQEIRPKYGVKQTIKIGHPAADGAGTLHRVEHAARLKNVGIDLEGVADPKTRKWLGKTFGGVEFRPVLKLYSQRTKLVYHPKGDPETAIELGFDLMCKGETFFGFSWSAPQVELELIKGDPAALAAEESLLMRRFSLKRDERSKPYAGFEALKGYLSNGSMPKVAWPW